MLSPTACSGFAEAHDSVTDASSLTGALHRKSPTDASPALGCGPCLYAFCHQSAPEQPHRGRSSIERLTDLWQSEGFSLLIASDASLSPRTNMPVRGCLADDDPPSGACRIGIKASAPMAPNRPDFARRALRPHMPKLQNALDTHRREV